MTERKRLAADPVSQHRPGDPGEEGLLRVLQSKAETRAFYDKISKVYDLLSERSEAPVRRLGLQKLAARPGELVLEVGYGTGHCLVTLATAVGPNGRVYGVDVSSGMAERARRLLADAQLLDRVHLTYGDGESLPLQSDTVTGVFISFTLELFDTPAIPRVLAECHRVLRIGGRIVAVGLSKEGPAGLALEAFEWTHQHFPNLLDCRPIYVRRALDTAGFRVTEAVFQHMWVPVEIVLATKP